MNPNSDRFHLLTLAGIGEKWGSSIAPTLTRIAAMSAEVKDEVLSTRDMDTRQLVLDATQQLC